ncbi:MAG: carboxymuconolactone decarboxylase family protein [Phycisphaerales bacterium JB040]
MPRITPVDHASATGTQKELLDGVKKKIGKVPNLLGTMAHSPAVLKTYLALGDTLGEASLSAGFREQIAVAVAGANRCGYCASAHTAIGKGAGVSGDELARNLKGEASDAKTQAALDFARAVVAKRGFVEDSDFASVREAGFNDGQILEIITVVVANILTNYLNHAIETDIDFPKVEIDEAIGV